MDELPLMAEGGAWVTDGSSLFHYITNPDTLARLLADGFRRVDDPRQVMPALASTAWLTGAPTLATEAAAEEERTVSPAKGKVAR